MNATIEPRTVEPKPIRRWLKQAAALIFRRPILFTMLTLGPALLDMAVVAAGIQIHEFIRIIAFTIISTYYSAIICEGARAADLGYRFSRNSLKVSEYLLGLAFSISIIISVVVFVLDLCFNFKESLVVDGAIAKAFYGNSVMLASGMMFLFMTLNLAYGGGMSKFSPSITKAAVINKGVSTRLWMIGLIAFWVPSILHSLTQLPEAATFSILNTLMSVVFYVAYRDIFEHRGANEPVRESVSITNAAYQS